MPRTLLLVMLAVFTALIPARAFAQDGDAKGNDHDGVLIRVNGDARIAQGETISNVFVVNGDVVIDGTVTDTLFVIRGDVIVTDHGRVEGDINVVRGNLTLAGGSHVDNVMLLDSDITQEPGATVTGDIKHQDNIRWGFLGGGFWIWLWLSMTVAVILAGLIFAAVGGLQLERAADALTRDTAMSILAAVIIWVGGPMLAVLAFVTVVGIPFGLGILLVALPALWFLGYIVAGARLGLAVTRSTSAPDGSNGHPYLATFVGLLALQIVALIPVIGWFIAIVAGLYGAGGLALIAFRGARGTGAAALHARSTQPGPA